MAQPPMHSSFFFPFYRHPSILNFFFRQNRSPTPPSIPSSSLAQQLPNGQWTPMAQLASFPLSLMANSPLHIHIPPYSPLFVELFFFWGTAGKNIE
jgi:hypothetical protein